MSQHYDFTHRALLDLVLNRPPEKVRAILTGDFVDDFLEDVWDQLGEDPLEDAPDDTEAFVDAIMRGEFDRDPAELPRATDVELIDGTPGTLIRMPQPESMTEAYFILVLFDAPFRYFTLERSNDLDGNESEPMLCEWDVTDGERRHINYGELSSCTTDAFLEAVSDRR